MWHTTARLIRESAFRPDLTAALYRLAAGLPAITLTVDAADALGRPGIAVSFRYDDLRSELVFDRDTYRFLGSRTIATADRTTRTKVPRSSPERAGAEEMRGDREFVVTTRKGTVTDAFAIVTVGLADALPPSAEKVSRVTVPC